MASTSYGYLHGAPAQDMDGSSKTFEWFEAYPQEGNPQPQAGWFCYCEVEPEAGWLGPFDTEAEAINAATTEEGFMNYQHGPDPMGDWHGANV